MTGPSPLPHAAEGAYIAKKHVPAKAGINISTALAGQTLGMREIDDDIRLVGFMHYDIGYIDLEEKTLQTMDNPFNPNVLSMS